MSRKILGSIFFTTIIMVFAAVLAITGILYYYYSFQETEALKDEMAYLKQGVERVGTDYFSAFKPPERITYIKSDGTVLYDNYAPGLNENHLNRPEVEEALKNGEGSSVRYSNTLQEDTVYFASRLSNGDILRLSVNRLSFAQLLNSLLQVYTVIFVLVLAFSFLAARYLARNVVRPISRLNPEKPDESPSYPELAPLTGKISDQNKQIEDQLKDASRQRADFETITASMNEGVIVFDTQGVIRSSNKAAISLLDVPALEPGEKISQVVSEPDFSWLIRESLSGRKEEVLIESGERTLEVITNPIYDGEKQTGTVIIILDVTEREQRERLRREYVSNISHELKTPLTGISGFAEIIKSGIARPEDVSHFVDKIYDESQELIRLVNDILTVSYLDEAEGIDNIPVNMKELTEEIVDRLWERAQEREIEIKIKTSGNCQIEGDRDILSQILYNLLDNAVKYNVEKGKVELFLDGSTPERFTLTVKDTGMGIPESEQARIFERFYRSDKSRSKVVNGTGLGLSIVKHAALVHNAQISLLSKEGEGSAFSVEFKRSTAN